MSTFIVWIYVVLILLLHCKEIPQPQDVSLPKDAPEPMTIDVFLAMDDVQTIGASMKNFAANMFALITDFGLINVIVEAIDDMRSFHSDTPALVLRLKPELLVIILMVPIFFATWMLNDISQPRDMEWNEPLQGAVIDEEERFEWNVFHLEPIDEEDEDVDDDEMEEPNMDENGQPRL